MLQEMRLRLPDRMQVTVAQSQSPTTRCMGCSISVEEAVFAENVGDLTPCKKALFPCMMYKIFGIDLSSPPSPRANSSNLLAASFYPSLSILIAYWYYTTRHIWPSNETKNSDLSCWDLTNTAPGRRNSDVLGSRLHKIAQNKYIAILRISTSCTCIFASAVNTSMLC